MARKKRKDAEAEELLAPDAFETAGGAGVSWLESNIKWVLLAAIVILGRSCCSSSAVRATNVHSPK